jgi:hypothetical protein
LGLKEINMAIRPNEASKIPHLEQSKINEVEARIDSALKSRYSGEGTVEVFLGAKLNERSMKELKRRYALAGWQVQEGFSAGNQREPKDPSGVFFKLTARPTRGAGCFEDQRAAVERQQPRR